MARPNINKRIEKALNTNSDLSDFVMNVLTPDYIQGSSIIDEDTFQFISDFMKGYDTESIRDSVKGITLKALNSMKFTGDADEDFNNFLEVLAKGIKNSNEVVEVIMDIHNCILLERNDLNDIEIVRNINLVLAVSAFDVFRVIPENTNQDLSTFDPIVNTDNKGELNMNTITGKTITFGNGHTAKTVVVNNNDNKALIPQVERIEAEIVSEAASTSTENNQQSDTNTSNNDDKLVNMAKIYLDEMKKYPNFEKHANCLSVNDVIDYVKTIEQDDATTETAFNYIQKVASVDNDKANALFVLFMYNVTNMVLEHAKKAGIINDDVNNTSKQDKSKEIEENTSKLSIRKIVGDDADEYVLSTVRDLYEAAGYEFYD